MLEAVRPEPIRSPVLDEFAPSGVKHGFFTRKGGVSEGLYQGLNVGLGSDDQPDHIAENRRRVARVLGAAPGNLITLHQVHSAAAVVVDAPFSGDRPQADAMVSNRPGLALGALAADCGPVLFADPHARVIGAAHAGWKGALTGILEAAIAAMEGLGASRDHILAVLGPSISGANYEVGPEFRERFLLAEPDSDTYFTASRKAGHHMFDLPAYTVARLQKAGVYATALHRCTYAEEALFYSYRRSTHRSEPDYGRQVSAIILEDN